MSCGSTGSKNNRLCLGVGSQQCPSPVFRGNASSADHKLAVRRRAFVLVTSSGPAPITSCPEESLPKYTPRRQAGLYLPGLGSLTKVGQFPLPVTAWKGAIFRKYAHGINCTTKLRALLPNTASNVQLEPCNEPRLPNQSLLKVPDSLNHPLSS